MKKVKPQEIELTTVDGQVVKVIFPLPDGRSILNPNAFSYYADGMATIHSAEFMTDPKFIAAYRAGANKTKPRIWWRAYVALWAAQQGLLLKGDFVECGVHTGMLSKTICEYIKFSEVKDKKFYLLDTYCGIVESLISEEEKRLNYNFTKLNETHYPTDIYEKTLSQFSMYENVELVRGMIPGTLAQVPSTSIAYLSIDMNAEVPEIAAGEFFWPKLSPGAFIVLDDYGWSKHKAQKAAWDRFASARGVTVLSLPTGQGLLQKPGPGGKIPA